MKKKTKPRAPTLQAPKIKIPMAAAFQKAIDSAIRLAEARVANRDACLTCGKPGALMSITYRSVRVGRICRHCWRVTTLSE